MLQLHRYDVRRRAVSVVNLQEGEGTLKMSDPTVLDLQMQSKLERDGAAATFSEESSRVSSRMYLSIEVS